MRAHHRPHAHPGRLRAVALRAAALAAVCTALLAPAPAASASVDRTAPAPASAWSAGGVDDFVFDSFHAEYALDRDDERASRLGVVETLVADFPDIDQNHGIERALPRAYAGVDLGVEVIAVTDATGTALPYELRDDDGFLVIRIGSADRFVHGRQSYVIEYRMRDVVRSFGDTGVDEFYWDINGTGSAQPYRRVSAALTLAPVLWDATTGAAACYVGREGDTATCPVEVTDDGAAVDVSDLGPFETVTWSIAFRDGTFRTPPTAADSWIVRVAPWVLVGVVAACLVLVLWLRLRVFRDAPGRGIVVPQYEPFPELGVMEAAVLLGREPRGLPAQFVQLVVTRAARLVDRGAEVPARRRYRLELADTSGLDRDDLIAVAMLFGRTRRRTGIDLDTSDRTLGDRVASLRSKVRLEVATRYRTRVRSRWTVVVRVALALAAVAALVVGLWAAEMGVGGWLLLVQLLAVWLGGAVLFALAGSPEVLTPEGALAREHLDGIRDYLELAEADRLRVLQSPEGAERRPVDTGDPASVVRLDERLLPYAMLFGIEDRWQRELGTAYESTPTELTSVLGGFPLGSFATGYAAASFATTPPPSSSSSWSGSGGSGISGGSSGGGFAGGGGGGGGAGGW